MQSNRKLPMANSPRLILPAGAHVVAWTLILLATLAAPGANCVRAAKRAASSRSAPPRSGSAARRTTSSGSTIAKCHATYAVRNRARMNAAAAQTWRRSTERVPAKVRGHSTAGAANLRSVPPLSEHNPSRQFASDHCVSHLTTSSRRTAPRLRCLPALGRQQQELAFLRSPGRKPVMPNTYRHPQRSRCFCALAPVAAVRRRVAVLGKA